MASDVPAISPPPPIGAITVSRAAPRALAWWNSSSPTVPWPAMICGSSKAGTTTAPRSAAAAAAIASRFSVSRSYSLISAP